MREIAPRAATSAQRKRRKRAAAVRAVDEVRSGMAWGLGAGSTARFALARIAERIAEGPLSAIAGVPSSREGVRLYRSSAGRHSGAQ
jgi:ribose 5-phosphate isomerase A